MAFYISLLTRNTNLDANVVELMRRFLLSVKQKMKNLHTKTHRIQFLVID